MPPTSGIPGVERGPGREVVGEPAEPVLDLGAHGERAVDAVDAIRGSLVFVAANAHTPVQRTSGRRGYVSSESWRPARHHGSGSGGGGTTSDSIAATTGAGCSGVSSTSTGRG